MATAKKTAQKENKSVKSRKKKVAIVQEAAALVGEVVPANHILNPGTNIDPMFAEKVQAILAEKQRGRQQRVTSEMYANAVQRIEDGESVADACKAEGFEISTFYRLRRINPDLHKAVVPAHETGLAIRVETSLLELKDLRLQDCADHKEAQVAIRHKEASYRATMDYASRIDQTWSAKQQNVNLNVNTNVTEADVSKWFNG